jgi:hypothetical protein
MDPLDSDLRLTRPTPTGVAASASAGACHSTVSPMAAVPRHAGFAATRLTVLLLALAASTPLAAQPVERRAVELTFLKSQPGQREQLKTFVAKNWFAMDQVAKDQGLLVAFTLLESGTDDGEWNVVVSVTYQNEKGYDGIAEAFERIRRAHTTVLVEGKGLRELGRIVESKRLYERPMPVTP